MTLASSWIAPRAALFAEHFDLRYPGPEPGELEFVLRRIQEGGAPVLELGCGTGRMLAPLLERGIEVVGVDVSPDMLDRCRATCAARAHAVDLHVQAMQQLQLERRFGTIFMGSCGLGVLAADEDVRATFRKVSDHLVPGGVFCFEIETPPGGSRMQDRAGLWSGGWHRTQDGAVLATRLSYQYDAATRVRSSLMILERYIEGQLAATELHESRLRFWKVDEVAAHLEDAGLADVRATRVFSDDDPPGDCEWLVLRARKP